MKSLPKISFKYTNNTKGENMCNINENMKYKRAAPLFQHWNKSLRTS